MSKRKSLAYGLSFAAVMALSNAALAQKLTIGLSSEPTAIDPHYHELTPNIALSLHMFDALVSMDENSKIKPSLAASWENRDDTTWVFKLRDGVKFSNGAPFTANDVIYSFCRVLNNETSVSGSFTDQVKNMASVEKEDDKTIVIKTKTPEPLILSDLTQVFIISSSFAKFDKLTFDPKNGCGVTSPWPTVTQFNDGSIAAGTGPYKLKSYVKGSGIELVRNDGYWGDKPAWSEVKLVPVPNAGPRLAGLLAGDYDVIENPAARDVARIKANAKFSHVITPSNRVIFLQLDQRDNSPFIKTEKGGNPFKDLRVRQAVSQAIDRKAIVTRIMDGAAAPANQFIPGNMFGAMPDAPELPFDPANAKKLLAEAGYPNGFEVTLSATNDRYINDGQIAQAIAQYLTQIGIKTNVDAMTRSIFFTKRSGQEFSFSQGGWGSTTGEASSFLRAFVATRNKDKAVGLSNYGGFSDPEFDPIILKAITTVNEAEREKLLRQAGKRAMEQMSHIPIHFESSIWAFRSDLDVKGRADQMTLAMGVKPKK